METEPDAAGPQAINCPQCGRSLRALRTPRCNWCGAPIPADLYGDIAAQSRHVMAQAEPPPLPPVTSYAQTANWRYQRLSPFSAPWGGLPSGPLSPGQSRLRTAVLVIVGALALVRLGYGLYAAWLLHHILQTLPHR